MAFRAPPANAVQAESGRRSALEKGPELPTFRVSAVPLRAAMQISGCLMGPAEPPKEGFEDDS